jgi:hypothetical protein
MTDTHQPFIDIDNFLANNGYVLHIQSPTVTTLQPYMDQLNAEGDLPWTRIAKYGMAEAVKDIYQNPQVIMSFDSSDNICSVMFYYEVTDQGDPFLWIEAWGSKDSGLGSILTFLVVDQADRMNFDLCANPGFGSPGMADALEQRPYLKKDQTTKWFKITVAQIQAAAVALIPQATGHNDFQKVWNASTFPTTGNPARFDWNTNLWVDTVVAPQDDFGTMPAFIPNVLYKFDYNKKWWTLNNVTLMDSFQ